MKKEWVVIGALVMALLLSWRSCASYKSAGERVLDDLGKRDTVLRVFYDKLQRQHSVIKEREFDLKTLESTKDSEIVALRNDFNGRLENLQSRLTVYVRTTDTVRTAYHDTIVTTEAGSDTGHVFMYEDEWSTINGLLLNGETLLNYSFRAGITVDRKWERERWWKRKHAVLDITMQNPNARLESVQTFVVRPDPKRWYETDLAKCAGSFALGYYLGGR